MRVSVSMERSSAAWSWVASARLPSAWAALNSALSCRIRSRMSDTLEIMRKAHELVNVSRRTVRPFARQLYILVSTAHIAFPNPNGVR
jgi:hypothetical protein